MTVLPRIERQKYDVARDRVFTGAWTVDAESGEVIGERDEPIGCLNSGGYVVLGVWVKGRVRLVFRSRVVWESVHGRIPDGYEILHVGARTDDAIDKLALIPAHRAHNEGKFEKCAVTGRFLPKAVPGA